MYKRLARGQVSSVLAESDKALARRRPAGSGRVPGAAWLFLGLGEPGLEEARSLGARGESLQFRKRWERPPRPRRSPFALPGARERPRGLPGGQALSSSVFAGRAQCLLPSSCCRRLQDACPRVGPAGAAGGGGQGHPPWCRPAAPTLAVRTLGRGNSKEAPKSRHCGGRSTTVKPRPVKLGILTVVFASLAL